MERGDIAGPCFCPLGRKAGNCSELKKPESGEAQFIWFVQKKEVVWGLREGMRGKTFFFF